MADNAETPTPESESTPEAKDKVVPLSEVITVRKRAQAAETKLAEYEAAEEERRKAEMTEIERLKSDNESLAGKLSRIEVGLKKVKALDTAVAQAGDGWDVSHALEALKESIDAMEYDDPKKFQDRVTHLVEAAKRPKAPSTPSFPGPPNRDNMQQQHQPPRGTMSPMEMAKLKLEDPEGYAEMTQGIRSDARVRYGGGRA